MAVVEIPGRILEVFANPDGSYRASPYKVLYGGRGGAKSWGIARMLIGLARLSPERILCAREFQSSIGDSVHKLLKDQINTLGMDAEFDITDAAIRHRITKSEFMFKGLRRSMNDIKSAEAITRTWVEEAHPVSKENWDVLRPTVFRTPKSEMWISFNPDGEDDATYKMFVKNPPTGAIVQRVGWQDNPWFPSELDRERRDCLTKDTDAYDWIWEGNPRKISEAVIFKRRVSIEEFDEPINMRPLYGMDFGFADDPAALIRSYVHDDCLYVTHEAVGYHYEIDRLAELMDTVPGARDWPIKADQSQPMVISYIGRQGFNISAADKWPGSLEDGVEHMKGFKRIVVHPRCTATAQEFRLYSYKTDPRQLDANGQPVVLPVIKDAWNHCIDAIRYGLDGYIQSRGGFGVWAKLAS